jgi:hypothetical protein
MVAEVMHFNEAAEAVVIGGGSMVTSYVQNERVLPGVQF